MIKAIFFDFDGVLTTDPHGSFSTSNYLSKILNMHKEDIINCYKKVFENYNEVNYRTACLKYEDRWDEFCTCLRKEFSINNLFDAFLSTPKNKKMFDLVVKLKKNYKVGIITDNTKERFDTLVEEWNLIDIFDSIILSAEVGSLKKEKLIFEKALDSLSIKAEECIFIDNTQHNLNLSSKMGFKTIYHDDKLNNIEKLKDSLKALSVVLD